MLVYGRRCHRPPKPLAALLTAFACHFNERGKTGVMSDCLVGGREPDSCRFKGMIENQGGASKLWVTNVESSDDLLVLEALLTLDAIKGIHQKDGAS